MNAERYQRLPMAQHIVRSPAARSWDAPGQATLPVWQQLFLRLPSWQFGVWPLRGALPSVLPIMKPPGLLGPRAFWRRDPAVVDTYMPWWIAVCKNS